MNIPEKLGQIWIGPRRAPVEWMRTWVEHHPHWTYTLYDNAWLDGRSFRTQAQIDEYLKRGWYAGAADLLRYEILYREGGYLAGADSICLHAIDDLLKDGGELYTVYENEFLRGKLVAPIMAAVPGHPFLNEILDRLSRLDPRELDVPWRQTGNLFVAELIEELKPDIVIWPSHVLIPEHFAGWRYRGDGKVYARHMFGETTGRYRHESVFGWLRERRCALYRLLARQRRRSRKKQGMSG